MPHYCFRAENEADALLLRQRLPGAGLTLHKPHRLVEVVVDTDMTMEELRGVILTIPHAWVMAETLRPEYEESRSKTGLSLFE
ncbi:MAG TPA: hypothetical protein VGN00_22655 [Puia sp.]|jgi:hypothetical protein